jgi:hypothetical protein
MSKTAIEIKCSKCKIKFTGVTNESLESNKTYSAKCSNCNNIEFFNCDQIIFLKEIHPEAVNIMYVALL